MDKGKLDYELREEDDKSLYEARGGRTLDGGRELMKL